VARRILSPSPVFLFSERLKIFSSFPKGRLLKILERNILLNKEFPQKKYLRRFI